MKIQIKRVQNINLWKLYEWYNACVISDDGKEFSERTEPWEYCGLDRQHNSELSVDIEEYVPQYIDDEVVEVTEYSNKDLFDQDQWRNDVQRACDYAFSDFEEYLEDFCN